MSGPNFREIDQSDLIMFVAENIPQVSVSVDSLDGPVPPCRNRFVVELGQGIGASPQTWPDLPGGLAETSWFAQFVVANRLGSDAAPPRMDGWLSGRAKAPHA